MEKEILWCRGEKMTNVLLLWLHLYNNSISFTFAYSKTPGLRELNRIVVVAVVACIISEEWSDETFWKQTL